MNVDAILRDTAAFPWQLVSLILLGMVLAALGLLLWRRSPRKPRAWSRTAWGLFSLVAGLGVAGAGVAVINERRELIPKIVWPFVNVDVESSDKLKQLQDVRFDDTVSKEQSIDDWPQWLGPRRNGTSPCTGLRASWEQHPPEVVWKQPIGGGFSSLAIAGERLYTLDKQKKQERVVCLDSRSGKELWNYAYDVDYGSMGFSNGPRATPAVAGGHVYSVGTTGVFLCLDANPPDGHPVVRWRHDLLKEFDAKLLDWGMSCSPLVDEGLVFVQPGGNAGTVAAFDADSGTLVWAALSGPPGYSSPVAATVAGTRQVICFTSKGVDGFRAGDGARLWHFDWPNAYDANIATPIVFGNYVFISSAYNAGCALLEIAADKAGKFRAEPVYVKRRKLMRNHHATCVLLGGFLYGFDTAADSAHGPNLLKCVDVRSGQEKWSTTKVNKGCLITADGRLFVLSQDGTLSLLAASPDGFQLLGQMPGILKGQDCWALPALAGGRLYLRDHHEIVCLNVKR